jgi:hypothetical protein
MHQTKVIEEDLNVSLKLHASFCAILHNIVFF